MEAVSEQVKQIANLSPGLGTFSAGRGWKNPGAGREKEPGPLGGRAAHVSGKHMLSAPKSLLGDKRQLA